MNATHSLHRGHRAGAVIAVSTLLIALASCSEEKQKRDYSIPRSLCGTPVDSDALTAFLPSGKVVSTKATATSSGATRCTLSVDGKPIVRTTQEWWNDMSVLQFARGLTLEKVGHQTDDGRFAYSGNEAFGKTGQCHNDHDQVMYTAVLATGSKHRDTEAMKKLITKYTDAVQQSSVCR